MKTKQKLSFLVLSAFVLLSFKSSNTIDYKCMVQLENYKGYGAYLVASIVDADGNYKETLKVLGDDNEWHADLKSWWKFRKEMNHQPEIDAITGASIQAGDRAMFIFSIDEQYVNTNHFLRFESAVEDQEYYQEDVQVTLNSKNLKGKFDGSGYVRYVRIIPSK